MKQGVVRQCIVNVMPRLCSIIVARRLLSCNYPQVKVHDTTSFTDCCFLQVLLRRSISCSVWGLTPPPATPRGGRRSCVLPPPATLRPCSSWCRWGSDGTQHCWLMGVASAWRQWVCGGLPNAQTFGVLESHTLCSGYTLYHSMSVWCNLCEQVL
jgi:hypothetical protein